MTLKQGNENVHMMLYVKEKRRKIKIKCISFQHPKPYADTAQVFNETHTSTFSNSLESSNVFLLCRGK